MSELKIIGAIVAALILFNVAVITAWVIFVAVVIDALAPSM